MSASKLLTAAALLLAASPAMAKTDIGGCVSSDTVINDGSGPYFSRVWYVPGTGEVCEILDCGGGRAPPKTNVPGCPGYKGSETYSPSYIDLKTDAASEPTVTTDASAAESTTAGGAASNKATYEATLTTEAPKTDKAKTTLSTAVAESESSAASGNGTVTSAPVYSTPASGSSGSGSASGSDSTATPAASTAGAASMTTGGALVALMAGAAAFAML